ncbi:M48 family metallopeptidase [Desulfobacula sp.]|uniref:M48 family metallopeptidase n=1 Tax=Desulfobacula sp. TaxID=2593537 RepID=UPI002615BE35|nr:SprT family zinc-dependent metalloprotease [Desulfobacula sp.]
MNFGNYSFEIVKKKIKHVYFRVYPSKEKIIVSAPIHLDSGTLNKAILSKSDWLNKQVKKAAAAKPDMARTYTTGETLLFKGKVYPLYVNHQNTRSEVFITADNRINLLVKPGSDVYEREKIIVAWYRKELKRSIGKVVAKWQPVMGVIVNEFGVRKMKTRWGSCNINDRRIWLNMALINLVEPFLEYVIVHEMVHLLERRHNARFKGFMDQFIPDWRKLKKELDRISL